jgi:hypothetical protein
MPTAQTFDQSVFINCPFDVEFRPLFAATVFAVHAAGFVARSALEISDASQTRLTTICTLIAACRYGIHDLSRTELDRTWALPRFNMPLELGIFLGCKRFGPKRQQRKSILILDREAYRYQKFISDIAGQDIVAHQNEPQTAMRHIRDWLRTTSKRRDIPGGASLWAEFTRFQQDLPQICADLKLTPDARKTRFKCSETRGVG